MATGNNGIGHLNILKKGISFVTATPVHSIGDRVVFKGDEYVYCFAKTTCPIGYAVQISASTSYSVTVSCTTDQNMPIGIVQHVAIPSSEYGWILTRGVGQMVGGLNTTLDNLDRVIMVSSTNTGNTARKTLHTAYSQLAGEPTPFAIVLSAADTAGSAGNAMVYVFGG